MYLAASLPCQTPSSFTISQCRPLHLLSPKALHNFRWQEVLGSLIIKAVAQVIPATTVPFRFLCVSSSLFPQQLPAVHSARNPFCQKCFNCTHSQLTVHCHDSVNSFFFNFLFWLFIWFSSVFAFFSSF